MSNFLDNVGKLMVALFLLAAAAFMATLTIVVWIEAILPKL